MKRIIIIRSAGNELANQLWNYASVYAYALERGYTIQNPAFFEYGEYFRMHTANLLIRLAFFLPFRNYTKRKSALRRRIWRKFYTWYAAIHMYLHRDKTLSYTDPDNAPFYLPPTKESGEKLSDLERTSEQIFLDGWLFRNPVGLKKYRTEIQEYFQPRRDIENSVRTRATTLRSEYKKLIGVHIRQGDYTTWRGGIYFIPQTRVREILNEYIEHLGVRINDTCFVITSDGPINASLFKDLHTWISRENAIHDLFLLASTDTIIGSDSTFGAWASYYGNIPFIVMQKEPIDWNYYKDKKEYFENKYSTWVRY
jgi:hypothetical protein